METAARREREAIQRSHRLIDRTGGDRSQTPTMDELLNRNPATPSPRIYFVCTICLVPRPLGVETSTENTCVYCQQGAVDIALQLRWCIHGIHEAPRHTFTRPGTGTEGVEMCNPCFFSALDQVDQNEDEDLPEPPSSQATSEVSS